MKDIKGYEGLYAVTSCGKVWSYRSKIFLKPKVRKDGYLEVSLSKKNERKSKSVHRLVAEAYIPNPDNLPQISHVDETRANNAVTNLKWCDAKENCNMPQHIQKKKANLNNATSKQVVCKETGEIYPSLSEVGRRFGCTPQNIRSAIIRNGLACGYHWRYADD